MINEYQLYSDESFRDHGKVLMIGGLICTDKRANRLRNRLAQVRETFNLTKEMRWGRVSARYLDAYKAWLNVFLEDPFARYSILRVDMSSDEWKRLSPQEGRKPTKDAKLASAFYQFLLISFGKLRDTKRWWVYPDAGFFSRDAVIDKVEYLFNRTYKQVFGSKTSRIIRRLRPQDSRADDLIQLADVILGLHGCLVTSEVPTNAAKRGLLARYQTAIHCAPKTRNSQDKFFVKNWVSPDRFSGHDSRRKVQTGEATGAKFRIRNTVDLF